MTRSGRRGGFTLLEVVVATVALAVGVVGALSVLSAAVTAHAAAARVVVEWQDRGQPRDLAVTELFAPRPSSDSR